MSEWELIPGEGTSRSGHQTRDEAIARAMSELEPGDEITVHAALCAMKHDRECDCEPNVLVVPRPARA